MPWVRLDDDFYNHPKVIKAGPLGIAMHVAGLCYCNHYLTDGFIPFSIVPGLLNLDGIGMRMWDSQDKTFGGGEDAEWNMIVEDLVNAGLWEQAEDGYTIHDYLDYQPSRAQVMAEREQKRAAGSKGGLASAKSRAESSTCSSRIQAPAQAESKPNPVPNPVPNPFVNSFGANNAPTPPVKPARKPKSTKDERTDTPAIQACYKTVGKYPPLGLYDKLIGALGNAPDIQRLTECRTAWLERGYNNQAWTWATEWYVMGVPSRNGNGNGHTKPADNELTPAQQAILISRQREKDRANGKQ